MRRAVPLMAAMLLLLGMLAAMFLSVSFHERAAPPALWQPVEDDPAFGAEAGTAKLANVGVAASVIALTAASAIAVREQRER